MPDLRTIIVDDEPLALELMRPLLERIGGVEIIGEAHNGRQAIAAVAELEPDLLFLDIHMPGLDGFDVVKALQPDTMPLVVFATAYEQYALDAFDVHAVDYVLKPFNEHRLKVAVERARRRYAADTLLHENSKASVMGAIDTIGQNRPEGATVENAEQLIVRDSGTTHFVDQERIDWIDAAGDYMCIHVNGDTIVARMTMESLLDELDTSVFARIHRSTVVNLARIERLKPLSKGEAMLFLKQGKALKVSRSYGAIVRRLIN
jgi:two-component system LytT family response regulator